ncbi:o-succinylbenzoate--CoA ligase [Clostridium sporogenes]|nr:o-succinylbenzoate--CoA ligase [Clostridium sporogenes]NFS25376.1 o-succinylbenzoate--CoA ligase [Clostridium sporogenes]
MKWLYNNSQSIPDKRFINSLTYRRVYLKTMELSMKIKKFIGSEKRIAIISNNSQEFALMILALMNLKVETLLLNSKLKKQEIEEQLKGLEISLVFSEDNSFISFCKVFNTEIEENEKIEHDFYDEEDRTVFIMNTSATTGKFKSVPISLSSIKRHVSASKEALGYSEGDNWLLVLPMFHVGGLSILLRSLYNGTSATIVNKFNENEILNLISNCEVNMVSMIPTMLRRIIDRIENHDLRVMLLSGEFIDDELVKKCIRLNIPVYKSYGMTETTSQIVSFNVTKHLEKLKSVGKPLNSVEIKIDCSNFLEYTKDRYIIGEITVKAPMIMDGYINKEKVSSYFNTGDIGYLDKDGFLYVLDRRSNLIISGGENIYPLEIENILYNNPKIKECAIVSKKDLKWGQVPILYAVTTLTSEQIIEYLKHNLANYKLPKKIIFRESLPKNSTGKIQKKFLRGEVDENQKS